MPSEPQLFTLLVSKAVIPLTANRSRLEFARPELTGELDADQAEARSTRRRLLDRAAQPWQPRTFAGRRLLVSARRIVFEVERALGLAARVARAEVGSLPLGFSTRR